MRTLSSAARQAMYAPQTGAVALALLTISGTGIPTPLRFTHNQLDVVSRGTTYLATAFTIVLPDERDDAPPRVSLVIDNVARDLTIAFRALTEPPTVALEVILAATPDTVEAGPFPFTLRNIDYTAEVVTGDLLFEDFLNEGFPCDSYTPSLFPGLFGASVAA